MPDHQQTQNNRQRRRQRCRDNNPLVTREIVPKENDSKNSGGGRSRSATPPYLRSCHRTTTSRNADGQRLTDQEIRRMFDAEETTWSIFKQTVPSLFMAGIGMVFAGLYLKYAQNEVVFMQVKALTVLVPAIIGLKGNLEMTLASRLSSLSNLGLLDTNEQRWEAFKANFCLTMSLSIFAGFVSAIIGEALSLCAEVESGFDVSRLMLLCGTCIITTCFASLILGTFTMCLILASLSYKLNPDNIATPIAAALGDLLTLFLLHKSADFFFLGQIGDYQWVMPWFLPGSIGFAVFLYQIAMQNEQTERAYWECCKHTMAAVFISCGSGVIFEYSANQFDSLAVYQPLFNGIGGNMGAVQSSRMSTYLHKLRSNISDRKLVRISNSNAITFFSRGDASSRTARVMMVVVFPLHISMFLLLNHLEMQDNINCLFLSFYLLSAFIQVCLVLYQAELFMNQILTTDGNDPDNVVIPYLTSCADIAGTLLLYGAYVVYTSFPQNYDRGELKEPFGMFNFHCTMFYITVKKFLQLS